MTADNFSDILKELIDATGLSLRQLGKLSKVSHVQYGKYLAGSYPTHKVALRISNYFKVSFDYLFGVSTKNNYEPNRKINFTNFVSKYEKILKQNNITHYKFVQEFDLSESCLRHWKYGNKPTIANLIIIAKNLYSSIDYLIGLTD